MKAQRVPSTCPHDCPSTCALEVERIDDRTIGRIYGAKGNPYTAGVVCAKVARYAERIHHPARLTRPLVRTGAKGVGLEAFAPVSWEEALDRVADRLVETARRDGSESVWPYFYAGTMGLVQRDNIECLRHAMRYSRQHSTFCVALADAGWNAGTGAKRGVDPREIGRSDLVVVWGGNPVSTQVNVMHHVARARRDNHAGLVVIDPYRTGTAEKADLHLMLRPGTDGALACAVMHVLFREGHADWEYMREFTDAPDALARHLERKTPAWAAGITGLEESSIVEFARLYGTARRPYIRIGYGFSRSRNGAVNMHAVSCLPAVRGAWRVEGGGALYGNTAIYGVDQTTIMGLDVMDPDTRVLDQSRIGPILCGDAGDLKGGPPVNALFVQNTNPMVVAPQLVDVREGLSRKDLFTCVHEQFMTDTAAMADVVLPATMFLEHDDLYQASGHTFLQVARKVVDAPGECRSNHWVLSQLGLRLGATHPGLRLSEWDLIEDALKRSGLPNADTIYDNRGHDCALDFERAHYLDGFAHPDGRFRFQPRWSELGLDHAAMPALPDHYDVIDRADAGRPFRLVTAPARQFLNSSFTETPTSRKRERVPTLLIHPEDLQALNANDGAAVKVGNERASVTLKARGFDGVQRGVVVCESIWPNAAFDEGIGINALVSAEPGVPNGGAVYHDTAVWVRAG